MRDERSDASRRRLLLFWLISPMASASIGCTAGARKRMRRVGLMRTLGSAIGLSHDEPPLDQTVPAVGLGVTPVEGLGGQTRIDGALDAASVDAPGRLGRAR